jgi:hypothetical protein
MAPGTGPPLLTLTVLDESLSMHLEVNPAVRLGLDGPPPMGDSMLNAQRALLLMLSARSVQTTDQSCGPIGKPGTVNVVAVPFSVVLFV